MGLLNGERGGALFYAVLVLLDMFANGVPQTLNTLRQHPVKWKRAVAARLPQRCGLGLVSSERYPRFYW